jgi:hypothetical protein
MRSRLLKATTPKNYRKPNVFQVIDLSCVYFEHKQLLFIPSHVHVIYTNAFGSTKHDIPFCQLDN